MYDFEKIGLILKDHGVKVKETDYGYFTAAKVCCEEDYELLKKYYSAAKTYGCGAWYSYSPTFRGKYEGPDWYFPEGSAGDRDSPETYRLESLTFKKKEFERFCKEYEEA